MAGAAAFLAAWFYVWRLVQPWETGGALAFIPAGRYGNLVLFAASAWALAALCALVTLGSRPEGSLLAALAGLAALALHGGPANTLLWRETGRFHALFPGLAAETAAMALVLLGMVGVALVVRALAGRLWPGWKWQPVMEDQLRKAETSSDQPSGGKALWREIVEGLRVRVAAKSSPLARLAGCLLLQLAISVLMLVVTFRSSERGQIAFALLSSFFVAAWAAHQAFPARNTLLCILLPLGMGLAVTLLGAAYLDETAPAWYHALRMGRGMPIRSALPVDWLSLGCGGAVAGIWLSRRMHEDRLARPETEALESR